MWKQFLELVDHRPVVASAAGSSVIAASALPAPDLILKFLQIAGALIVVLTLATSLYRKWFGKKKLKRPVIQLLLIDDSESDRFLFSKAFTMAGCHVAAASTVDEAIDLLKQQKPLDLILLDTNLNGENTASTFRSIKTERPLVPCAILTGAINPALADEISEISPGTAFFKKPVHVTEDFARGIIDVLKIGVPH